MSLLEAHGEGQLHRPIGKCAGHTAQGDQHCLLKQICALTYKINQAEGPAGSLVRRAYIDVTYLQARWQMRRLRTKHRNTAIVDCLSAGARGRKARPEAAPDVPRL